MRRLLRIVPAYWLVLFVTTSVFHTGPGIGPGGWKAYASHYLFLQIYFPSQDLKGISAAWSLCVEMTFYLFIPLYAALIGRRRPGAATARPCGSSSGAWWSWPPSATAGGSTSSSSSTHHSPYFRLATIWLPAYLDLFALGMGLAVVSAWMHHRDRETAWLGSGGSPGLSWACALACFWGVSNIGSPVIPVYFESDLDLARQTLYSLFAFFLLLPAVFGPQGRGAIRTVPAVVADGVARGDLLRHLPLARDLDLPDPRRGPLPPTSPWSSGPSSSRSWGSPSSRPA